jgi:hypothetical protein
LAGFLTYSVLSAFPLHVNSGKVVLKTLVELTVAGTVPDSDRIPFYATNRMSVTSPMRGKDKELI